MKKVLITGCSSGLGLALTRLYLQKGYKVYGVSRNKPDIKDENFDYVFCDLSNLKSIKRDLAEKIIPLKEIELVYLNAGMLGKIKTLDDLSIEELQEVYNLNVYANKELLDILKKIDIPKIIAISSGASVNGSKGWASYSLSKTGINMLINLYAKEMTKTKLLSIAPGVIETPMTDYIRFDIDDNIFTSAKKLKNGDIQKPKEAALKLDSVVKRFDDFESGSFIDVRKI